MQNCRNQIIREILPNYRALSTEFNSENCLLNLMKLIDFAIESFKLKKIYNI